MLLHGVWQVNEDAHGIRWAPGWPVFCPEVALKAHQMGVLGEAPGCPWDPGSPSPGSPVAALRPSRPTRPEPVMEDLRLSIASGATCISTALLGAHLQLSALAAGVALAALYLGPRPQREAQRCELTDG